MGGGWPGCLLEVGGCGIILLVNGGGREYHGPAVRHVRRWVYVLICARMGSQWNLESERETCGLWDCSLGSPSLTLTLQEKSLKPFLSSSIISLSYLLALLLPVGFAYLLAALYESYCITVCIIAAAISRTRNRTILMIWKLTYSTVLGSSHLDK